MIEMEKVTREKFITLRLPQNDVRQVINGLTERMVVWKATAEYLETGFSDLSDSIEECSDPEEAKFIAQYYEKIINLINKQLERQNAVNT